MSGAARPRLAFVSPLPPVRSGISDYATDLLPHVAQDFAIEVFVDERHPLLREGLYQSLPVHPPQELRRRIRGFAHVVYQMGNNLHHRFVLELAREMPGILVLHDVVLHHLYEVIAGVEDAWDAYGRALRDSYGRVGERVLSMKRWRLASERENFALPLFESLAAAGRGIIVHSRHAEREVRRRLPTLPVRRMPMGIPLAESVDPVGARRRLGVDDRSVIVASFGFLIPTKRIDVLTAAFARARREFPDLRLVLIGEESPGTDLGALFSADDFASGRVVHRGYVSGVEYRDWMAATDVAVNLRFPTAGETSASLLRLLGDGKCTLVSAYRQFLEIPP
jgi:glycosyltransferase involved in cell wall biosynthesis